MHHIDLGLFKYQLDFTQEILKRAEGTNLQREFNDHLRQIPCFPGLKLISYLGHLKVVTVADYHQSSVPHESNRIELKQIRIRFDRITNRI